MAGPPSLVGLDQTVVTPAAKSILSQFCVHRRPNSLQKAPFVKSDAPTGRHPVDLIREKRLGSTGEMLKVPPRGRRPGMKRPHFVGISAKWRLVTRLLGLGPFLPFGRLSEARRVPGRPSSGRMTPAARTRLLSVQIERKGRKFGP